MRREQRVPKAPRLTPEQRAEFNAAIEPVELASRRRISGRGRGACIAAWRDRRRRFLELRDEVLEDGRLDDGHSPAKLLVHKVFEGAHLIDPLPASQPGGRRTRRGDADGKYGKYNRP